MKNSRLTSDSKMFHRFTSLGNETVKQDRISCNSTQNIHETKSLKHLALKVLERNKQRNNPETNLSKVETEVSNEASDHKISIDQQELKESAEYLYFERLGISDNEELSLDEAFSHIIKTLTIH